MCVCVYGGVCWSVCVYAFREWCITFFNIFNFQAHVPFKKVFLRISDQQVRRQKRKKKKKKGLQAQIYAHIKNAHVKNILF